jgi:hypothetical protein
MRLEEREQICLELLGKLPLDGYVLIGGYAISSFEFPRFSVDLDLVIPAKEEPRFTELAQRQGFQPVAVRVNLPEDLYGGRFQRFERAVNDLKVGVDLLINAIISRQTKSSYSFNYLARHSEIREVSSFSKPLKVRARVANREMLIALKANSMRLADKRDLVALCQSEIRVAEVVNHLKRCPKKAILTNLQDLLNSLEEKRFKDSLKGVFLLPDEMHERLIHRAEEFFLQVEKGLGGQ